MSMCARNIEIIQMRHQSEIDKREARELYSDHFIIFYFFIENMKSEKFRYKR